MRFGRTVERRAFLFAAAVLASLFLAIVVGAQSAGEQRLLSGEVVSLAGCLMKGHMGSEKADVGQFDTAERGLPIGILDTETDQLYIAVYRGGNAAPKLAELMGKKVNAQGATYFRHGVHLIDIQVVAEQ
jgi:hypothetical protein